MSDFLDRAESIHVLLRVPLLGAGYFTQEPRTCNTSLQKGTVGLPSFKFVSERTKTRPRRNLGRKRVPFLPKA